MWTLDDASPSEEWKWRSSAKASGEANSDVRRVIIGKNSKVWKALSKYQGVREAFSIELSHQDVFNFPFTPSDDVWILSYSSKEIENRSLIDSAAKAGRIVYFNSASSNVLSVTGCYSYPRLKAAASAYAKSVYGATIVHLGYLYKEESDLPGGCTAAVREDDLAGIFREGFQTDLRDVRLFKMTTHTHRHRLEARIHEIYDRVQRLCGSYPCLLRPLDVLLRAAGCKWYGYMNLSNRLWLSTRS